jgi:predicted enzyme related to lactoylglutathione lyase
MVQLSHSIVGNCHISDRRNPADLTHRPEELLVTSALKTVIYPVKDLAKAKKLYGTLLGVEPIVDEVYYVQFNTADQQIGLDPKGHRKGMTGSVCYWPVEDIKDSVAKLLEAGATELQAVSDVGGGMLIALVKDADGNVIGLSQTP